MPTSLPQNKTVYLKKCRALSSTMINSQQTQQTFYGRPQKMFTVSIRTLEAK